MVKLSTVRTYALSLPETSEEPHFNYGSFRVKGKIFVTVPPDQEHIHVFIPDQDRDQILATYPQFSERLTWGSKVVGVRVSLSKAAPAAVRAMIKVAWGYKAPKSLQASTRAPER